MPRSKKAETTLYAELIRRGLPVDYARRTAEELDDHRADLLADLHASNAADPVAIANERLGETRQLAKRIAGDYRRRTWFGRHPIVTFALAPIPLWIAAAAAFYLTLAAATYPLDGPLNDVVDGLSPWTRLVVTTSIVMVIHALVFSIVPCWLSRSLARLALQATQQRTWAIAASCLIGVAAASLTYKLSLSMTPGDSRLFLVTPAFSTEGFSLLTPLRHYLSPLALAQLSGPIMVSLLVLYRDEQARRRALLAPYSQDMTSRLAA